MDEKELKKKLGQRINYFRVKAGLTQEELAEKIGRSQRQISLIEIGSSYPSPETVVKISQTLNCSVSELFDFELVETTLNIKEKMLKMLENLPEDKLRVLYLIGKNI